MLKTLSSCLTICVIILFVACNRTPQACLYPSSLKSIDTISLNTTLNFDAGCSRHATRFEWHVIHSSNTPDSNLSQGDGKYYSYKFEQTGLTQIRVIASNKSGAKSSLQRNYYIKP